MSMTRVCFALFCLQVYGAVWASENAGGEELPEVINRAAGEIVTRNLLLNRCPSHSQPQTLPPPQELAGEWCGLQNSDVVQNATGTSSECSRTTLEAVGDQLRVIGRSVKDTGDIIIQQNMTLTRLPNEGWVIRSGNRTANFFIGFPEDRRMLVFCQTVAEGDAAPDMTLSYAYVPCLAAGEDPATRRTVARCDLPAQSG